MSISIIPTKLYIPPLQESVISRSRLIDKVINGLSCKLTLISAPAGFGKTTLLSECTNQFPNPVAWISLDKDDNDKPRFLSHLISGLAKISEGFGISILEALQSNQPPSKNILLSGLINEIIEIQKSFVIILDDYHVITNTEIHEILTFIVENQPSEMHLIVSSRSDPPWPLARWRVRQEMTEIRSQDLRFSLEETATFLNDAMQLCLSDDDISKLDSRTEGWIAGLLMAAISLQGRDDIASFIQTFEGSHRFIFDYLVEEVLNQLSSETQNFLLRTSILERLCAPLCDSILNTNNSQAVLHQLDTMNLFIIPLDNQRYWYRYHHLFSDLLSSRLIELQPNDVTDLHLRASNWYENNEQLLDAIDHAFKAKTIERVAQLIEDNVLGIIDRGELGILIQWLDQLPEEVLANYPWLRIAQAWALTQAGSLDATLPCLISIEDTLHKNLKLSEQQNHHIAGHIAAIRCYIELLSFGDHTQAVRLAQKALDLLPSSDLRTRGMVLVTLGTMQRVQQNPSAALETLKSALEIYRARKQPYVMIDIISQMARVRREQGFLHKTVHLCQEALNIANQYSKSGQDRFPVVAYTMGVLGRIYYEWNQLDKAIEIGLQGLAISERWGQANTLMGSYLFLARIYRVQRRFQDALDAIQAADDIGSRFSDTHEFVIRTHKISIRLAMGDFDAVEDWVNIGSKNFDTNQDERLWELAPHIIALYYNNRIDSLDDLLAALDRLSISFNENGIQRRSVIANIQQAIVLYAQKKYDQSLLIIEQALTKGKKEGYIRSFIDQSILMEKILVRTISAGIEVDYANDLLSVLQNELHEKKFKEDKVNGFLIAKLTQREIEVLRLLSTGLSIPEIAGELVITTGTLRTHIKRVYSKLDSHSRFEAVARAKELNLL